MTPHSQSKSAGSSSSIGVLCTLLLCCSAFRGAAGLTVVNQMTRITAPAGSPATLQCRFQPQPEYIIWSFRASPSASLWRTLVHCQLNTNTCGSLPGPEFSGALMTANGSMWLPNVQQRHNGSYKCEAYLALDSASTEGWLIVTVPPGQPEISAPTLQASEGEQFSLTCVSGGASPPANLIWRFVDDARPIAGATVEAVAAEGFDRSESRVSFPARAADDGARVVCEAEHPLRNISSAPVRLAVLYKPVLSPAGSVSVALGSRVDLACSARGNPQPWVQLIRGSETLAGPSAASVTYSLGASSKSMSGMHRCSARNSQGESEQSFNVDIQYGPSVSSPASVAVREGSRLQLDCQVDSNPEPSSVSWRRVAPVGASAAVASSNSSRLVIKVTSRSHAGRWRCEAVNRLLPNNSVAMEMSGSADTIVMVEYAPGQPTASISKRRVLRGDNVSLVCLANAESPGIPSPTFEWTRSSSGTSAHGYPRTGLILTLAWVTLGDAGMYYCTPVNSAGRGPPGIIQLDVEQPPDWRDTQPRPNLVVEINGTGDLANPYSLSCSAEAKPLAEIFWYKDGKVVDRDLFTVKNETTFVESSYYRTSSTLLFQGPKRGSRLRPEDNGRYLCEAKNTHGKVQSVQELSVAFKPQIQATESTVALPVNGSGSVNLTCPVIGQPMSALIWLRNGEPLPGGTQTADSELPYRLVSQLPGLRQTGEYSCRAQNRLGLAVHVFRLVNASVPEAPTEVEITGPAMWDQIQLAWRPGFAGLSGDDLRTSGVRYYVQISKRESRDLNWIELKPLRADSSTRSNITHLMPDTNYSLVVYAVNSLGRGPPSHPPLSVRTPPLELPKPSRVRIDEDGALRVVSLSGYCLRVESSDDGGATWSLMHLCLASDKPELPGASSRLLYRVSMCLASRQEVCGPAVLSTDGMAALPDVSTATIAIVGGCCAGLILLLSLVLLYFCCRRRRNYKEMEAAGQHPLLLRRPQQQQQQQQADSPAESSFQQQQQQARFHMAPDGKPYALVPPHPSMSADNVTCISGSRRSSSLVTSAVVGSKDQEAGEDLAGVGGQSRSGGVFATLRSGHNPLDSSASNPAIFNYSQDYPDDNRNTDPYNFDSGYRNNRKIVYEVVV